MGLELKACFFLKNKVVMLVVVVVVVVGVRLGLGQMIF